MLAVLLALAAPTQAAPAVQIYRSHDIGTALRAGCKVQQVSIPAGKLGQPPAIIRCEGPNLAKSPRAEAVKARR